ncbi:MAG: flagellar FlbD family protein [Elusimicrobiales bacterium]|jgi:flagellar protein FlbD|nr:flagellar FlbD family protein [Elusimicrobiales bacterium]HOL63261.1 flagellar FlbD family protein [Elusimicrobiales bacterium]HPO96044.1 flagellar FlbD family protein [Elusimicrobiales bacterium]
MILLHKLNNCEILINAELIESVESSPDTVINLVTGNRFIVRESKEDVEMKVIEYKKKVYSERRILNPIEGFEKK